MTAREHAQTPRPVAGQATIKPVAAPADAASRIARAAELLRGTDERLGSSHGAWRRGYLHRRLLLVSDVVALFGSYGVLAVAESVTGRDAVLPLIEFVALTPLWIWLASLAGLYHLSGRRLGQSFVDEAGPVAMVTTMWAWVSLIVDAAISSGVTPLFGPIVVWAAAMPAVIIARGVARRVGRRASWFREPVLLIGDRDDVDRVLRRVMRHPDLGLDPVAALVRRDNGFVLEHLSADGSPCASLDWEHSLALDPSHVERLVNAVGIDRVIVTGWSEDLSSRTELIRVLAQADVCVDYVSGEPEALSSIGVLNHIEGLPILTIRLSTPRVTRSLKRAIDVFVAGACLVVFSPLLAYAAVRIRLSSPGPILFRQPRTGIDGAPFELLKLRTMVDGADGMRPRLWAELNREANVKMLKVVDDPRITAVGAWLRRWSIDELPQLWNVIRGEMSLVGPRPLPLDEADFVEGYFVDRLRMRPGMTGPWQIHGRSDIPFDDMVKLDYLYVATWTMREDMRLLARTVGAVLRGRGAY